MLDKSIKFNIIIFALFLLGCEGTNDTNNIEINSYHKFYDGDYSETGIIGQSLPGTWRPFSNDSPWNTPIPENVSVYPNSNEIIAFMDGYTSNIRFAGYYTVPIWVVNSENMPIVKANGKYIFDTWDKDYDNISDVGVPIDTTMWGENTPDGHIVIIDPFKMKSWEMSQFRGIKEDGLIDCSTFNIWDLKGNGYGNVHEGKRWYARGGRGSGFPVCAGIIRPEEIAAGEINHALVLIFEPNLREKLIAPPAARTDGDADGENLPIEGMRFQLNPNLNDSDFDSWGLTEEAKIVARALQRYGMYDGDNGGPMALQVQLLDSDRMVHREKWDSLFPGFYESIKGIPTTEFRAVNTGGELRNQ